MLQSSTGSTLFESWFALVQEGVHALHLIGGAEQGMEQMPFVAQAV